MKKLIILICFINIRLLAQDNNININTLNAPSSPVFNLMGLNLTDIERPRDPTDFYASIRNASEGFTTLPKNYSLEFAPQWIFAGRNIKYSQFESNKIKDNIPQSLVVSIATGIHDKVDTSMYSRVGFGFKFSILRGTLSDEFIAQKNILDVSLADYNKKLAVTSQQFKASNPYYLELKKILLDESTSEEMKNLVTKKMEELLDNEFKKDSIKWNNESQNLRKQISKLDFKRTGFLLDFSGAMLVEYPTNQFSFQRIGRAGCWLTATYVPKNSKGFEGLAIARYMYSYNSFQFINGTDSFVFAKNKHYFDLGLKLNYSTPNGKLTAGIEGIARFISKTTNPYYKYSFNINYEVLPNKVISFSIGQDYTLKKPNITSSLSKSNLLIAMNLLLGFGNNRPISN